jgi:hypothetical protein
VGIHRLVIVGDSFEFDLGIPRLEDRLGEKLTNKLMAMTDEHWEPITASYGGWNTLDEIKPLNRAVIHQPELVVLNIDYLIPSPPKTKTIFDSAQKFHPLMILFRNSYLFVNALAADAVAECLRPEITSTKMAVR